MVLFIVHMPTVPHAWHSPHLRDPCTETESAAVGMLSHAWFFKASCVMGHSRAYRVRPARNSATPSAKKTVRLHTVTAHWPT